MSKWYDPEKEKSGLEKRIEQAENMAYKKGKADYREEVLKVLDGFSDDFRSVPARETARSIKRLLELE